MLPFYFQVKPQFQEILRLSEENVGKSSFSLGADVWAL